MFEVLLIAASAVSSPKMAALIREYTAELPRDVTEIRYRSFAMPLNYAPGAQGTVKGVRVYVSKDRGKTWVYYKDCETGERWVTFHAAHDGLYWFALQLALDGGTRDPGGVDGLVPDTKVYI